MAEWHVSGSESEGERVGEGGGIEVGGLRIPPPRVAELLQAIEKRQPLDFECMAGTSRRRERRRKLTKHRRKNASSPTNSKSLEEVSETASELRSTTSTDVREGRWNNLSHFDYFHEDSSGTDLATHKKQRKLPPGHREKKLASLDRIVADVKQQRERNQDQQITTPEIALLYPHPHPSTSSSSSSSAHYSHNSTHALHSVWSGGQSGAGLECERDCSAVATGGGGSGAVAAAAPGIGVPSFSFDDDSDLDSPTGGGNMKMSVLSQINRVEKLLDDEGLT